MTDFSIFIGGQAGEGIKRGASLIGKLFNRYGYHIFIYEDYGSIIRGGQDYAEIRIKDSDVLTQFGKFDYMFSFHEDVFERYKDKQKEGCFYCIDGDLISFDDIIKKTSAKPFMKTSIVFGFLVYMFDIPYEFGKTVLEDDLKENSPINIELMEEGYNFAKENNFPQRKLEKGEKPPYPILYGNDSIALSAVRSGMKVYTAYPITPTSTLLDYLARNARRLGIAVIHTEDEIASIVMAIGAAFAGAPSMVGSSGPGFDLMGEAISLAGGTETPLVILDVQRTGPTTGAPTYTEQSDLNLALNIGHGEFPRIVLAIGSINEAFEVMGKAFQYAWWYQTPVIVLSDKHISESAKTSIIPSSTKFDLPVKLYQGEGTYKRYIDTEDGISPLTFPGVEDIVAHTNSTEHTEDGYSSSIAGNVKKMKDKRLKKFSTIEGDFTYERTVYAYGDLNAENVLIGFGSTKGAILEAIEGLPVKYIQIVSLEPFPKGKILKEIRKANKIIAVENNSFAQLATLFELHTKTKVDSRILKYDARPFDPWELRAKIEEVLE